MRLPHSLLRVLVCGSVDDGKSTLIGRILHDTGALADDVLEDLRQADGRIDLSQVTDGLESEREQGITIDVAYRQFRTERRDFGLIDCPGHEQYTRNMATGAAGADAAVILVDARKGLRTQTKRHLTIVRAMGIRLVVGVVNKMDTIDYAEPIFQELADSVRHVLGSTSTVIPVCASDGEGITRPTRNMPWYSGPTLLQWLESAQIPVDRLDKFRMPIQLVTRHDGERFYLGTIASGAIATGDEVVVSGGARNRVAAILGPDGEQATAEAGEPIALRLADPCDAGRGTVLAAPGEPAHTADRFVVRLVWCDDRSLRFRSKYIVRLGTASAPGTIERIRHVLDLDTGRALPADDLAINEIGTVQLSIAHPVPFEPFDTSHALGGLILIAPETNATVAVGMIETALEPSSANVAWQSSDVSKSVRSRLLRQNPLLLWFTGLPGAGKTTLANLVEKRLHAAGRSTYLLDGDNLRHGLCRDLSFTPTDRAENVRRVSEVATLMVDAGLIVLVSLISPSSAERNAARERVAPGEFVEIFVDTPVEECRRRDPKGLYVKADRGLIQQFTGVSAPYEPPAAPEIHIRADALSPESAADLVIAKISQRQNRTG